MAFHQEIGVQYAGGLPAGIAPIAEIRPTQRGFPTLNGENDPELVVRVTAKVIAGVGLASAAALSVGLFWLLTK